MKGKYQSNAVAAEREINVRLFFLCYLTRAQVSAQGKRKGVRSYPFEIIFDKGSGLGVGKTLLSNALIF